MFSFLFFFVSRYYVNNFMPILFRRIIMFCLHFNIFTLHEYLEDIDTSLHLDKMYAMYLQTGSYQTTHQFKEFFFFSFFLLNSLFHGNSLWIWEFIAPLCIINKIQDSCSELLCVSYEKKKKKNDFHPRGTIKWYSFFFYCFYVLYWLTQILYK